jgi:hypothetical protein
VEWRFSLSNGANQSSTMILQIQQLGKTIRFTRRAVVSWMGLLFVKFRQSSNQELSRLRRLTGNGSALCRPAKEGQRMIDKMPGEKQSIEIATLPNMDTVIYQVTSQHWAHAEQIRWTLLYNLLVANTILLLAWAAIFATNMRPAGAWLTLTCLSFVGLCVSLLWIFLQRRANGFT